jgi:hypothetical protein
MLLVRTPVADIKVWSSYDNEALHAMPLGDSFLSSKDMQAQTRSIVPHITSDHIE